MTIPIDLADLSPQQLAELRQAMRTQRGQRTLETQRAIQERDTLIRRFAARYHTGFTQNQQSKAIHAELRRYAGSTWQRSRADRECRHHDDRRRLIWQILQLRGGHVPAVRTIFGILVPD